VEGLRGRLSEAKIEPSGLTGLLTVARSAIQDGCLRSGKDTNTSFALTRETPTKEGSLIPERMNRVIGHNISTCRPPVADTRDKTPLEASLS